jgi:MFS family permease
MERRVFPRRASYDDAMNARHTDETHKPPPQPPAITMVEIFKTYPDFRLLSAGTVGSQAGQWILNIALGWLILELTDSALYVGLVGFATGIPMVLASVPAGIILDRVDRRHVLIACQIGMLLVALALTGLVAADLANRWLLLGAAFVYGALMAVNNAGRQTIVPATVPRSALAAAFGLTSAATHASRIVGPSIAGVLIGASGVAAALAFQVAILILALLATLRLSAGAGVSRASSAASRRLLEGFTYVRRSPLVLHLTLLAAIPMLFAFPYLQLLPVFARDILRVGPSGLGLMLAMSGVGAIAGGLLTERAVRIGPLGMFVLLATVAYGGIVLVVAYSTSIVVTIIAIMIGSVTGSLFQSLNNTLFQLQLDDDLRGRVTGVYMLSFGAYALGGLPLGLLADAFGPPHAVAAGAAASSAFAVLLLARSPEIRTLRKPDGGA